MNGTCNAETQRCDCFEGYIGAFCNIPSSSFTGTSGAGFSPPNQRFSNNSTLSNIFVLVVLTLLVFIVVVSIMLCKHRGHPGTAAALAAARRRAAYVPRNVPIFAVDISRSAWDQMRGKRSGEPDDVPFPIVIDTDNDQSLAYFVLRLPLDDVSELTQEELLDSGRAILAFRMASIVDTSPPAAANATEANDATNTSNATDAGRHVVDQLHPELTPSPLTPPLPLPPTASNRPQPVGSSSRV